MKTQNPLLLALAAAGVAAMALTSCSHSQAEDQKSAPKTTQTDINPAPGERIAVRLAAPEKIESKAAIIASGQFTTDDEAELSFKIGGVLSQVLVQEGDAIHQGQVLARLDLTEISTQVQQAQLALDKARRDFTRAENLYKDSVATLEQYQNTRTGLDLAEQQLTAARFNQRFAEIRAPHSGYILRKFANAGQVVNPGQAIFQTNGAASAQWKLKVFVSDQEWARLAEGDRAVIKTDLASAPVLEGRISRKAESADPRSGAFAIEISLPNSAKGLAAGLFAKAELYPKNGLNGYRVPYAALLDGHADSAYLFTTRDQKTVRRQVVRVKQIAQSFALVEGSLAEGEQIIVSGGPYLTEGSAISVSR